MLSLHVIRTYPASSHRVICDTSVCDSKSSALWNEAYKLTMDAKYAKGTRNFSRNITGVPQALTAPIYLIPRERGGSGYLSVPLQGVERSHVQYCPISKGFSMQDVSSFTLGPIVGEGLCLVNAAFSKSISLAHIEGGGIVDLSRKNFWKKSRTPHREIEILGNGSMRVNGVEYDIHTWLRDNESLWFPQWDMWRRCIAMCSKGDFHWTDGMGPTISYRKGSDYLNFVQWKKKCYIEPSYELLPSTSVFQFLKTLWSQHNIPLGLVHPKATKGIAETPITVEDIRYLYDTENEMCCQPYVVAGCLLGVPIYK